MNKVLVGAIVIVAIVGVILTYSMMSDSGDDEVVPPAQTGGQISIYMNPPEESGDETPEQQDGS
jgi:hypothetical protein